MARFIIIVFGFLAFAFYEMSGGADFDPEATRLSRIDAPVEVEAEKRDAVLAEAPSTVPGLNTENVTRVSLDLASLEDVVRPQRTLRTTPAARTVAAVTDETAVSEEEPTIIIPSLIVDQAAITPVNFDEESTDTEATARDLRRVTGSRVNVRGGPGTGYSVVNSLSRGDRVEILQDPGDGWVKLRPVGGGTVGWMADFLLSEG